MVDRIQGVLGLAKRAGALAVGTKGVLDAVRSGKARLVLLACDASENTVKQLTDKTSFRAVALERLGMDRETLGHCIGKENTAAVALLQEGFVIAYRKACRIKDV